MDAERHRADGLRPRIGRAYQIVDEFDAEGDVESIGKAPGARTADSARPTTWDIARCRGGERAGRHVVTLGPRRTSIVRRTRPILAMGCDLVYSGELEPYGRLGVDSESETTNTGGAH